MTWLSKLWWRFVKFGFRLLYNEFAFTYDLVSWVVSMGAWRCWQRSALQFLPEPRTGRILEVAHGTGNLHLDLHAKDYDVIGVDYSAYMGRITQGKFAKQGKKPLLVRSQAQTLPFESQSFAAIVCTFPTSFIFEAETLQEYKRLLVKDGCFVVVLNGAFVGRGPLRSFLEFAFRVTGQRAEADSDHELDDRFRQQILGYGFSELTMHEVPCPRSVANVLIVKN